MQFDYFYPEQADQYAFYRIPRRLFTDNNFKELTAEAKILYGLMLDRVSLSLKNMWIDKSRRVYIIFTLKEVMDGNVFTYKMVEQETLLPTSIDAMESGDWDLTLFTCTVGGQSRVTIRFELIA